MSLPGAPAIAPVVAPATAPPPPPPPPPVLSFNCTSIICYNNQLSDNQIVTTQVSLLSRTLLFLDVHSQASYLLSPVLCLLARLQPKSLLCCRLWFSAIVGVVCLLVFGCARHKIRIYSTRLVCKARSNLHIFPGISELTHLLICIWCCSTCLKYISSRQGY